MNAALTPVEAVLLRAAVYELLALGYGYPSSRQRESIQKLGADLEPWVGQIHPEWQERVRGLCATMEGDPIGDLEADFNCLFSGAMAAAPHETAYERDIFRKQHTVADIAGFYRAFGFQVPDASRWQPDHMGVEMEYCSILLQRASHALGQGWNEQARICTDALAKFLLEHLGRWSEAFASDVSREAEQPFYQHLAGMTRAWVDLELRALGLQPDRLRSRHTETGDAEAPACGDCTGCGPDGMPAGSLPPGCPIPRPPGL